MALTTPTTTEPAFDIESKEETMTTEPTTNSIEDASEDDYGHFPDGDDSDGDDSAASGERAFGAFKAATTYTNTPPSLVDAKVASIRRNTSWTSFLTRSERAAEHPDTPPSPKELAHRKVQFTDENEIRVMELDPPLTNSEKASTYMNGDDQDRMGMDVKMTLMRWDNHEKGHIPFDHSQHSVRGLIDEMPGDLPERHRGTMLGDHRVATLQEQNRQRDTGTFLDMDELGKVARESAESEMKRAELIGQKDHEDAEEAWIEKPKKVAVAKMDKGSDKSKRKDKKKAGSSSSEEDKKKKGMGKLAFWKS